MALQIGGHDSEGYLAEPTRHGGSVQVKGDAVGNRTDIAESAEGYPGDGVGAPDHVGNAEPFEAVDDGRGIGNAAECA